MKLEKFKHVIAYVKVHQTNTDPAHDITHINRVLHNALNIAKNYSDCNLDVLICATLLHDIVLYDKNSSESKLASTHSAELARKLLVEYSQLSDHEIEKVCLCIHECSYTKNLPPTSIESQILQDADRIESMGALAIMRTFTSAGQLNEKFYDINDPLCGNPTYGRSAMDFIICRVGKVVERLHTPEAKAVFQNRNRIVIAFIEAYKQEMRDTGIENYFV